MDRHTGATVQTFNSCTSRPDVCQCLVVQTPMDSMSRTTSSMPMTHVTLACESKLRSIVRSSVHPRPGNWVAIGNAVVYYVRAARAFSAGIKCWHCSLVAKYVGIFSRHQHDYMAYIPLASDEKHNTRRQSIACGAICEVWKEYHHDLNKTCLCLTVHSITTVVNSQVFVMVIVN